MAYGQSSPVGFTGIDLLKQCENNTPICNGFVVGVVDTSQLIKNGATIDEISLGGSHWCLPAGVTWEQDRLILVKWLKDHPENLHYAAPSLVAAAYAEAFPCKKP
jgi:hypothetical protein